MKRTSNTVRALILKAAIWIIASSGVYSYAGEVIFSFDKNHVYVQEGLRILKLPLLEFQKHFGEPQFGKHVNINFSVNEYYVYEQSAMEFAEPIQRLKTEIYGDQISIYKKPYYFLIKNSDSKQSLNQTTIELSPNSVEYTWVAHADEHTTIQRGPASREGIGSVYLNGQFLMYGKKVASSTEGVIAIRQGQQLFWFLDAKLSAKMTREHTSEFIQPQNKLLWVANLQ